VPQALYPKIVRLRLTSTSQLLGVPQQDVSLPDGGLVIVFGPNGAGKSLLASSLAVILRDEGWQERAAGLAEAGLDSIEVICEFGDQVARITTKLPAAQLIEHWDPPHAPGGDAQHPTSLAGILAVLPNASVIVDGESRIPGESELVHAIRLARTPLERELQMWMRRREQIVGADGHGGQLFESRVQMHSAEQELHEWRELKTKIESLHQRRQELHRKLADLAMNGAVLKVEREEIERKTALAERAVRLQGWLKEVRGNREAVERHKEEFTALQESLDHLTVKFRGVPDDFAAVIEQYAESVAQRDSLSEKIA
jgi:energy-coupling factor transporter ATP-binding protein EcfA2